MIYPVDSVVHLSNNPNLGCNCIEPVSRRLFDWLDNEFEMAILPRNLTEKVTLLGLGLSLYPGAWPGYFMKGVGAQLCQSEGTDQIVMFLPPVRGCSPEKGLQRGWGSRAPQDLCSYVLANVQFKRFGEVGKRYGKIWYPIHENLLQLNRSK